MLCSRVYRRALSMETAARATSSSARASSSASNGCGFSARQKFATPSTRLPVLSGTVISEWMPYASTWSVRSRSCARQPGASRSRGTRTDCPVVRLRACGDVATNRIRSPTGYSGSSLRMPAQAARRSAVPGLGSSPCSTASNRSTVAKSANRGTASPASSSAVRPTSRLVPIPTPASYSMFSRSRATSARPDRARSSVESRSVVTLPAGPPRRSVGRWLIASSRSLTRCTSSVATRPEASSAAVSSSSPSSSTLRSSASSGRSSRRWASSFASSSRLSAPTISTPSRTACSTASWCSYIRVISDGPRPCVWRSSRLLTRAVPPVASASAAAAAAISRGSCWAAAPPTCAVVIPADTRPTTLPPASFTGTTTCTSGPIVPLTCSVTVPPASAGPIVPTNFLPIRSGLGCV